MNETRTKFKRYRQPAADGTPQGATCWGDMSKMTKALKKQAAKSQLAAQKTTDPDVARQLASLAEAFRAQAAIIKKNKKKPKCPTP
jgi:hypothetical protein